VLRTSTLLLKPTLEEENELVKLADASSALWNIANYARRNAFFGHEKQPTYAGQCKSLKSTEPFKTLGTCKAQALLQKLNESRKAFWALWRLRERGRLPPHIKKVSPPGYWKKDARRIIRGLYVRNDGWHLDDERVTVSRSLAIPYDSGSSG
jgi:putative transposase